MNNPLNNGKLLDSELLASIAITAHNSILLLDASGNIHWANKGFEILYGYSLEEYKVLMGNENRGFIKLLNEIDANFFKNNPALTFTREFFTKIGKRKWIQSTLTPVKNAKGEIIRFIVIDTDFTQQKEMEEELVQRQENSQTLSEHLESVKDYAEDQITDLSNQKRALELAKERSEEVLNKVLPYEIAIQLKKKGYATPRSYKRVTLLQLNIRNFLQLTEKMPTELLVEQLHEVLVSIDGVLEQHYVEKIKTVGGIYLGAGGVPLRNRSNPIDVVLASLKIKNVFEQINSNRQIDSLPEFEIGIGVHSGKVIAGVVGKNKLSYDIWGDAVNISTTVERQAESGKIIITKSTFDEIGDYFISKPTGSLKTKDSNDLELFEIERINSDYSEDADGVFPNAVFLKLLSKL